VLQNTNYGQSLQKVYARLPNVPPEHPNVVIILYGVFMETKKGKNQMAFPFTTVSVGSDFLLH